MPEGNEGAGGARIRSLGEAVSRARLAQAERSDVVVDLRDAERARLDILADELRGVFAEVPAEDEQFVLAISPGTQPRLWIDQTGFVALARDRRTYRFLKDTRLGRSIILESADLGEMADCITNYIAERILDRQRAVEGDWVAKRATGEQVRKRAFLARAGGDTAGADGRIGWVVAAFLAGLLMGAVLLLAYAWVRVPG